MAARLLCVCTHVSRVKTIFAHFIYYLSNTPPYIVRFFSTILYCVTYLKKKGAGGHPSVFQCPVVINIRYTVLDTEGQIKRWIKLCTSVQGLLLLHCFCSNASQIGRDLSPLCSVTLFLESHSPLILCWLIVSRISLCWNLVQKHHELWSMILLYMILIL